MPSTYSPILGIELIASGEQANTWGFTTNNNLGTLIEQSIAGQADVVMTTSSHTLTDLDGVSDEARCMILNVSGVLATTGTVICPEATKVYVIANNTSGGYDIELRTSGGAGVLVPAGTAKTVFCDGVDVFESVTAIDTLLLGGDPTEDLQAVPRQYVDNNFLSLGGGTLTGALTLPGVPTTSLQAATKSYADQKIPLAGGTMTGPLYLSVSPVDGDPALQAATKYYVDNAVSGGVGGYVPTSRTLTAGTGLTGGGDLTANRTFALATSGVSNGTYANPSSVTVDEYGRITSIQQGSGSGVTSVTATSPVFVNGVSGPATGAVTLSMQAATSGSSGYLTSTDWNTFNSKISASGALGTPSSGTLTNCTGYTYANLSGAVPTWNQNTTGTAAYASAPAGGGSFITSANISSQSVSNAANLGSQAAAAYLLETTANANYMTKTNTTFSSLSVGGVGSISGNAFGNLQITCGTRPTNISGASDGYSCIFFQNSLSTVASVGPTGTYITSSDRALKSDIEPITYGLDAINALLPSSYLFNAEVEDREANSLPPVRHLGFIAQDVDSVVPEVVQTVGDHLGLDYIGLIPVLVKAIQELSAEVEALKAKVG